MAVLTPSPSPASPPVRAVPQAAGTAAAGTTAGAVKRPAPAGARPPARGGTGLNAALLHPAAKPVLFVACLLPLAWMVYGAFADQLGANPAEALIRRTGDWTLRMLCLTLAVTPLRQWSGIAALARFRRMLGVYAFFYVVLHFLAYAWLDMGFDPQAIAKDIPKRPFALVGFLAFVLMIPLAATSFNRAVKALGAKRWQALHKTVYAIVLLGLLHFFWMKAAKNNFGEWSVYAAIVAVLLGWRLVRGWRDARAAPPAPRAAGAR